MPSFPVENLPACQDVVFVEHVPFSDSSAKRLPGSESAGKSCSWLHGHRMFAAPKTYSIRLRLAAPLVEPFFLCALVPVGLRLLPSFPEETWPVSQHVVVVEHDPVFARSRKAVLKFGSRGGKLRQLASGKSKAAGPRELAEWVVSCRASCEALLLWAPVPRAAPSPLAFSLQEECLSVNKK